MFKNKYRIVTDKYAGYEVQIKRWWLPIYFQCGDRGFINSWQSIEEAENFAARHSFRSNTKVVKYL